MAEASQPSPRRRGVKLLVIAAILLVLLLVLLGTLRPDLGTYPGYAFPIIHALWLLASGHFGLGSFLAICGGKDDKWFRAMRTAVGVLIGLGVSVTFALGAFLLHRAMSYERTAADNVEHSSWDDD